MSKISIEAKQGVYLTYKNYPYKIAQVFGEYIDNAIQSFEDHKTQLKSSYNEFKLRIDIDIELYLDITDNIVKAKNISVQDNAAGMTSDIFAHAFNLTDEEMTRKGMNEFGIGMKAASAWLGKRWRIESTSIEDKTTRILNVDLLEVAHNEIKELESIEFVNDSEYHGTKLIISDLWPENVITNQSIPSLKENIASIYRYFIRNNEIQIFFNGELLTFEEYEILKAASYKDPEGEQIVWKKYISRDDHQGHFITGFIALLKDLSDNKRGVVFTRNHRVVLGFDPMDRTVGHAFMGQPGSYKYRRVFGELEISGFSVSFGKNQLNDTELLETQCDILAHELTINDTNLLTQATNYRTRKKKKIASEDNQMHSVYTNTDTDKAKTTITSKQSHQKTPDNDKLKPNEPMNVSCKNNVSDSTFQAGNTSYKLVIQECSEIPELFCNDISQISNHILICKINTRHPFFEKHGKSYDQIILLIKALSIAKYKTSYYGNGHVSEMMNEFNAIIKNLSID